ncbi:GntR family transcriptional regulator [Nocardiopsis protaetiae]|uniref:GntR family transcriptional regulator n=1 Tax=Nocardiopsis protaetiae TaxID=3382270 RepID=UPI00387A9528
MAPTDAAVRRITTRSVPEQVTEELRRAILCGDLAPGRAFSLREVAGMLGVSFIPVRDALRNLEAEGLIITRPGRSAIVAPLDLDELRAVYRLRRTLEPELASRSCTLLSEAELDRLEALATGFGDERQGMDDIYDAHHEFHMALLSPAMTTWDRRILTTLWRAAERYIRIGFGRLDIDPEEHERRGRAHAELVASFRNRDPQEASRAVAEHLAHNEDLALRALADDPDIPGDPFPD